MGDFQQYKTTLRTFQQRTINKSISQLLLYDKLADSLLEKFTKIKPATLSLLSFLPLLILAPLISSGSALWLGLSALAILIQQIMDIANKKQAYRLNEFSFATFYTDHLFDSLSVGLLVFIITKLMGFSPQNIWLCIYLFGLLPFYVAHLRMFNTGSMEFQTLTPSSEGLLCFVLLMIVGIFVPNIFQIELFPNLAIYGVLTGISSIWLAYYIAKQLWDINISGKLVQQLTIRNLFVIVALGYIYLQTTIITPHLLSQPLFFLFILQLNLTHFSILISTLMINYGTGTKFNQISLNTLIINSAILLLYTLYFFIPLQHVEVLVAQITMGILALLQTLLFIYFHRTNLMQIHQTLAQ